MNIQYKKFIMRPSDMCHEKFDLYKIGALGSKSKTPGKEKENILGYAMSLQNCINQIVHEHLSDKPGSVDFGTWLAEYKKEYEEVKKILTP